MRASRFSDEQIIGILHEHEAGAKTLGLVIPGRTYRHRLRRLLEPEFLYESLVDGLYFVNIRYMFSGARLTFIRGYKATDQGWLAFEEPAGLPSPGAASEGS